MTRITYQTASLLATIVGLLRRTSETSNGTRVLMFHDLCDSNSDLELYAIPASRFVLNMTELAEWSRHHQVCFIPFSSSPSQGIAVTFDDGYQSTLRLAADVLVSLGIPFHVFVTKEYVMSGDKRYLRESEIRQLTALPGATVGIHGLSHTHFPALETSRLRSEMYVARQWLEQLIGKSVDTISYPHGSFDERVRAEVQNLGFDAAACSQAGTFSSPLQRFSIPRIDIWAFDRKRAIIQKTRGSWDRLLP